MENLQYFQRIYTVLQIKIDLINKLLIHTMVQGEGESLGWPKYSHMIPEQPLTNSIEQDL